MTKRKDLTGLTFGRLTVIELSYVTHKHVSMWECKCICGNMKTVSVSSLLKGNTKSCGCLKGETSRWSKFNDLSDQRFGKLLVIKLSGRNKHNWPVWECLCDCGAICFITGNSLQKRHTKSCGCLNKEFRKLPNGEGALRSLVRTYKRNAKKRGLKFELSKTQISVLIKQNCFYCGIPPSALIGDSYYYNGIDRVDNAKHYFIENVVPCCAICQRAKWTLSVAEFEESTIRRYEWLIKNKKESQEVL